MILDAISLGQPREVVWRKKKILTSIFKTPVDGPRKVSFTNIEGDRQSDTKLHGGITRPISAYASEYYEFWKKELNQEILPWGYFGENLNISGGIFETVLNVGDRFSIGSVELEVLQPRFPCHKLGIKLGDQKWVKVFLDSKKTGFYFGVIKEGVITPGDKVEQIYTAENSMTIDEITYLYLVNPNDRALLQKAMTVERLTPSWKDYFKKVLDKLPLAQ